MVYSKRKYGFKKKVYRKKYSGISKKRAFHRAITNSHETKKVFEQVYDGLQVDPTPNFVQIADIAQGTALNQREGAKILLKGIRIKGQFSRDAGQSAVPDYFTTARIVLFYHPTISAPTLSTLLINAEGDASDMSAMIDTSYISLKMDKRMSCAMSNNQIQYFDKYIPINKVHTFNSNDATGSASSTSGRFGNWYVGVFGNGSDITNLGFIDCEVMTYFKDF